ncbi:hypothetical protein B0H13DRAFT_2562180 [Mycena leptocephala]|nr:hypothetical protein B0H13DRAFT_2562180 [Mycena leptocephala]
MMHELVDLIPAFPPEMEREIFETSALMHRRGIPSLLRVARRVLIWSSLCFQNSLWQLILNFRIEPLLYRVIRVTKDNEEAIFNAIRSKPADFLLNTVRHLYLNRANDVSRRILEVCTGVVNLALDGRDPSLLPILANMRLRRLSTFIHGLYDGPVDLKHPLFTSITHLDLFDTQSVGLDEILVQISTLPALTHLALDYEASRDVVETLLVECPNLELLLLLWAWNDKQYLSAQIPHVHDVRFVIGQYVDDYWEDWEAGAWGQPYFWSLGDDFVARKRSKAIEATRYWL